MSNIKTYVNNKHKNIVRAVRVTEKNYIQSKDWAGEFAPVEAGVKVDKFGGLSDHKVRVKTPKGWRVAKVGDYLVKVNHPSKGVYIEVGKEGEFLQEHTETTYKQEYNARGAGAWAGDLK